MKAKVESLDKKKCWVFHRWKILDDNGYTIYRECRKCNTRQIIQPEGGYQPVNWDWLNFKTNKI